MILNCLITSMMFNGGIKGGYRIRHPRNFIAKSVDAAIERSAVLLQLCFKSVIRTVFCLNPNPSHLLDPQIRWNYCWNPQSERNFWTNPPIRRPFHPPLQHFWESRFAVQNNWFCSLRPGSSYELLIAPDLNCLINSYCLWPIIQMTLTLHCIKL